METPSRCCLPVKADCVSESVTAYLRSKRQHESRRVIQSCEGYWRMVRKTERAGCCAVIVPPHRLTSTFARSSTPCTSCNTRKHLPWRRLASLASSTEVRNPVVGNAPARDEGTSYRLDVAADEWKHAHKPVHEQSGDSLVHHLLHANRAPSAGQPQTEAHRNQVSFWYQSEVHVAQRHNHAVPNTARLAMK